MKTCIVVMVLGSALLLSCDSKKTSQQEETAQSSTTQTETSDAETVNDGQNKLDINSIPVSTTDLGKLPYFSLPEGAQYPNRPIERGFDVIYFPIDGKMTPLEGRVFKSYVHPDRKANSSWSLPYFLRSYDEAITAVGGVKVFEGKVSSQELDRIKDQASYFGEDGSIDYWNEPVRVYVIRRPNGEDIYIQLYGNSASGAIQILQKEAFKQTITLMKSDEIKKELDDKGKAVLYINFDTDKASLKPDGKQAVEEISKLLKNHADLKLSVEGHTDNTGSGAHNQSLSKERAQTVVNALVDSGIDKQRLKADGFGAEKPLAANDTEENKAKNRRVELVKL